MQSFDPLELVEGRTPGRLLDLGDYPGLVLGESPDAEPDAGSRSGAEGGIGTAFVHGELVRLPLDNVPEAVRRLDEIEAFAGFDRVGAAADGCLYVRRIVTVERRDRGTSAAWTYVFARADRGTPVLADGIWPASPRHP